MHILGVSRTLPFHSIGGMQAIAWDLFKEFVQLGHRVTVVTTRIPGYPEKFVEDGVQVIALQKATPERYTRAWWIESRREVSEMSGGIDAVLSISAAAAGLLPIRKRLKGVPFLFQAHGTSWGEILSKWSSGRPLQCLKSIKNLYWLFKDILIYRGFDEVILVGDVLAKQFASWPLTVLTTRVSKMVIRNGVNTSVFAPDSEARRQERARLGLNDFSRLVVFAARMHPQKGGRQVLLAFSKLNRISPESHLLMIGGGEDEKNLRLMADKLGLSSRVHFTGAVSRDKVPKLLAAGDAFVFPTLRQEGLPMNVLEALATGLPTICSDSMRGVFDADLPIQYVKPEDTDGLSDAMKDGVMRGAENRSLLSEDYTLRLCAKSYINRLEFWMKR